MASVGLELISGVMGSGKSYLGAEIVYRALCEGAQVHTNLGLNWETINRLDNIRPVVLTHAPALPDVDPYPVPRFRSRIVVLPKDVKLMRGCIRAGDEKFPNVLVLDEASIHFYVDDQNTQDSDEKAKNREVFNFLVWSRRYGLEVYFLTQDAKNINVKLRRMAQYMTRCSNNNHIPYFAWLIRPLFGDFKREKIVFDEDQQRKLFSVTVRFSKRIGSFYHTHDLMDSGIVLDKHVTRAKPRRHDQTIGKLIVASFFLLMTGGGWAAYHTGMAYVDRMHAAARHSEPVEVGKARDSRAHVAVLVIRKPSYRVVTREGETFYVGQKKDGKEIRAIAEYGQNLVVTYTDKTTLRVFTK